MAEVDGWLGELERERAAAMRVRLAGVALVSAAIWFSHWFWYEAEIFPVRWHSQVYRAGELAICLALVGLAAAVRSLRVLEPAATALLCVLTGLHGFALLVAAESCFVPFLLTLEWGNIVIALAASLAARPTVVLFAVTWVVGVVATRLRPGFDADLADHIVLAVIYATVTLSVRNYDRSRVAAHRARHELGQANRALKEADEARSRLFVNLSHDFRTPLALIDGDAQRLAAAGHGPEVEQSVRRIRANTRAMADLTEQLLEMAKLDARAQAPEVSDFDLGRLAREVVAQFDGGEQAGRIAISGGERRLRGRADPRHVRRVVHNLLANAVRQLGRGASRIAIELGAAGDAVTLDVINDGPPIPAERRREIFERFASFDVSGSVASGIGLPLARELAELNQGRLELCPSEGVTVFRLTLPRGRAESEREAEIDTAETDTEGARVAPAAAAAMAAPLDGPAPSSRSLLIVEDNAQMIDLLRALLGSHFMVTCAGSLGDALEAAARVRPDVVLADVMLPDGSGLTLLERLPHAIAGVAPPIVFLSAAADEALRVEALSKGAADFVLKPFVAEELRARLDAACRGAEELAESLRRQRQQFVAELHDGVSSALARAAMLLEAAQRRQRHELVPLAHQAVMQALDQARSLFVLETRDTIPLGAATSELEATVRSALAGFDVACELTASSDGTLPALTGVEHHTLGRLAIEASTNALKHRQPKLIECCLTVSAGRVELRVTSDGSGSVAAGAELGSGQGLKHLSARLDRLNGWVRTEASERGRWTVAAGFTGALASRRGRPAQPGPSAS